MSDRGEDRVGENPGNKDPDPGAISGWQGEGILYTPIRTTEEEDTLLMVGIVFILIGAVRRVTPATVDPTARVLSAGS